MDQIFNVDWGKVFAPDTSLLEIFVRGTVTYLVLFALLRIVLKREAGTLGIPDLLVLELIADAAGMRWRAAITPSATGCSSSPPLSFGATPLIGWAIMCRSSSVCCTPAPLRLVSAGQMVRRNMRHELVSTEELLSLLRQEGVEDIARSKRP